MAGKANPGTKIIDLDAMFGVHRTEPVTVRVAGRDFAFKGLISTAAQEKFIELTGKSDYKGFEQVLAKPSEAKALWDALVGSVDFRDLNKAAAAISAELFAVDSDDDENGDDADGGGEAGPKSGS